jgi:hypothetical protein
MLPVKQAQAIGYSGLTKRQGVELAQSQECLLTGRRTGILHETVRDCHPFPFAI